MHFQPVEILDRKRGVESHLCLHLGDLVCIRKLTQHCRYRVTRDHIQDKKCDQGDGKNNADSQSRPLYDISDQASGMPDPHAPALFDFTY